MDDLTSFLLTCASVWMLVFMILVFIRIKRIKHNLDETNKKLDTITQILIQMMGSGDNEN